MTKARTNASASPAVGRNMVINGAMNVSARSASVTGLGNTDVYATLDRWRINGNSNNAGRLTMTQTADGPNGISANCLKLLCTTPDTSIAAGEHMLLQHRMEGQNLQRIGKGGAGAQQITISFYIKANASFTFCAELDDSDNARQITKLFDTTTDWVRHSFVIPADVDDGSSPFDDDNATSLNLNFWFHAGATYTGGTLNTASFANMVQANRAVGIDSFFSAENNAIYLTGVQLEVGPVSSEFEQEDIGFTKSKCHRYYYQHTNAQSTIIGSASAYSDTAAYGEVHFPTAMRAPPALVVTEVSNGYAFYRNGAGDALDDFQLQGATTTAGQLYNSSDVNSTAGQGGFFWQLSNSGSVAFQSEL